MVGCCLSMFVVLVLAKVTQAPTLQKVVELVLLPWVLRALCSSGSAARRGWRHGWCENTLSLATFCCDPCPMRQSQWWSTCLGRSPRPGLPRCSRGCGRRPRCVMVHVSSPHGPQLEVRQSRATACFHGSGEPCPMHCAHCFFLVVSVSSCDFRLSSRCNLTSPDDAAPHGVVSRDAAQLGGWSWPSNHREGHFYAQKRIVLIA